MNGCLNILWHIPFGGFVFAFFYLIYGVVMCCTIVFYPIGLGYLQLAKFMLSPFSNVMVSRDDYAALRGEKRNVVNAAYTKLIYILYIPFGIVAAISAVGAIVGSFCSIVGIPVGMVWCKAFTTVFNPVNKVCVPRAVADEIQLRKTQPAVQNMAAAAAATTTAAAVAEDGRPISVEVRSYTEERLHEIADNADMYRAELVEQCRHEIEIREGAHKQADRVKEMDDEQLAEILSSPQLYAEDLFYACALETNARYRAREEKRAREEALAAEQRAREEAEAEAERQRLAEERRLADEEQWRKNRPYVWAAGCILILILLGVNCYLHYADKQMEQKVYNEVLQNAKNE